MYTNADGLVVNPFAKRETYSRGSLITYKVLTILSWLLFLVFSVFHTFYAPTDGKHKRHPYRTIWGQNKAHPSPFLLNEIITSIYWYMPSSF